MPEISVIHIVLFVIALLLGLVIGWVFRSKQGESEKAAISAGWQEQFEAQRNEHGRLVEQNKSLMEQNSQYQASNKDSKLRAAELSTSLKEAFERRDELQRQLKDIRGNLEAALRERDQLQSDVDNHSAEVDVTAVALKNRDDRIAQLTKDLAGWQERVPPLIERFRARNEEAQRLEEELEASRERIAALEAMVGSEQTRVEPLDRSALGDDLYASNEPLDTADGEDFEHSDGNVEADAIEAGGEEAQAEPDEEISEESAADSDVDAAEKSDVAAANDDDTAAEAEDTGADEAAAKPGSVGENDGNGSANGDDDEFALVANGRERDNLKLIKGVGPAIEKTLNEMGIWRFHQIAEMSEFEIDRVARRLKGFRSRIYREDWIGQARQLDDGKTASQH